MVNIEFDFISNLTVDELYIMKKFKKENPFKIVEYDKNVGSGIVSTILLNQLICYCLDKSSHY